MAVTRYDQRKNYEEEEANVQRIRFYTTQSPRQALAASGMNDVLNPQG